MRILRTLGAATALAVLGFTLAATAQASAPSNSDNAARLAALKTTVDDMPSVPNKDLALYFKGQPHVVVASCTQPLAWSVDKSDDSWVGDPANLGGLALAFEAPNTTKVGSAQLQVYSPKGVPLAHSDCLTTDGLVTLAASGRWGRLNPGGDFGVAVSPSSIPKAHDALVPLPTTPGATASSSAPAAVTVPGVDAMPASQSPWSSTASINLVGNGLQAVVVGCHSRKVWSVNEATGEYDMWGGALGAFPSTTVGGSDTTGLVVPTPDASVGPVQLQVFDSSGHLLAASTCAAGDAFIQELGQSKVWGSYSDNAGSAADPAKVAKPAAVVAIPSAIVQTAIAASTGDDSNAVAPSTNPGNSNSETSAAADAVPVTYGGANCTTCDVRAHGSSHGGWPLLAYVALILMIVAGGFSLAGDARVRDGEGRHDGTGTQNNFTTKGVRSAAPVLVPLLGAYVSMTGGGAATVVAVLATLVVLLSFVASTTGHGLSPAHAYRTMMDRPAALVIGAGSGAILAGWLFPRLSAGWNSTSLLWVYGLVVGALLGPALADRGGRARERQEHADLGKRLQKALGLSDVEARSTDWTIGPEGIRVPDATDVRMDGLAERIADFLPGWELEPSSSRQGLLVVPASAETRLRREAGGGAAGAAAVAAARSALLADEAAPPVIQFDLRPSTDEAPGGLTILGKE